MTTKTAPPDVEAEALVELEDFIERTMPSFLRPNAPLPAGWPHSAEAYRLLQTTARGLWSEAATIRYVEQLAKGWRPEELANGPAYGQETYGDGSPKRQPPSDLSPDLQREAQRLLNAAAARGIHLDIEEGRLRQIVAGHGHPQTAAGVIAAVRGLIQGHDAQKSAAQREQDARPILVVIRGFRGPGGRTFAPGTMRIDPALADELTLWRSKMEADQQRHNWPTPAGFPEGGWPPFDIQGA